MNPEWKEIITEAVKEAADELDATYECCGEVQYLDVDPARRNSKFGSGSSGGCGAEAYSNHSYMIGSGNMPSHDPTCQAMQVADDKMWKAAVKFFAEEIGGLGLDPENVTHYELAEANNEILDAVENAYCEQQFDEDVSFRFGAFYYAPDNTNPFHPAPGKHGVYVFGSTILSGYYLGDKHFTYYEDDFSFETAKELKDKLTKHLTKVAQEEGNDPPATYRHHAGR